MHEICKCTCRLDASVSNNQQRWNEDKCWWECKELVDKGSCDNRLTWNPSSFELNVINHINVNVMLENIWTNKTSAEKN